MLSAHTISIDTVRSHWALCRDTCVVLGCSPRGDDWRIARNILVAQSEAEARERVFGEGGANRIFYEYLHNAQRALGVADSINAAEMTEQYAIYGSPTTVLDKLVAFRDQVGPFGGIMDWSGPNKAGERESTRLLAHDVMPNFARMRRLVRATGASRPSARHPPRWPRR
jgi:alkanesulfonate monooxygenase SsuD/methylene tetrahydromethanopterin reductase-like flavin-dependent oxidoreductase (luciferase family)